MKTLALLLACVLICHGQYIRPPFFHASGGAVTPVSFVLGGNQGGNTCAAYTGASSTGSVTCAPTVQTNAGLVVHVYAGASAGTITNIACTWNSVSMTQGGFVWDATMQLAASMFALANPATGSHTANCTVTGGTVTDLYIDAVEHANVDQTNPIRTSSWNAFVGNSDGSGNYSLAITSNSNDMTSTSTSNGTSGINSTNKTLRTNDQSGNYQQLSDTAAGASTVTHTWNTGATTRTMLVGFSICASGSGC